MNSLDTIKAFLNNGGSLEKAIQDAMNKTIQNNNSNPMFSNLINMAKEGNTEGIENFARNLFKEQGRDFDKEYAEFRKKFK